MNKSYYLIHFIRVPFMLCELYFNFFLNAGKRHTIILIKLKITVGAGNRISTIALSLSFQNPESTFEWLVLLNMPAPPRPPPAAHRRGIWFHLYIGLFIWYEMTVRVFFFGWLQTWELKERGAKMDSNKCQQGGEAQEPCVCVASAHVRSLWKTVGQILREWHRGAIWLSHSTPMYIPKRNEGICLNRNWFTNV